ncbi:MAG: APC family permease [Treponema sp.]|jgi:amino acid transporter|nr:APC family permease [Treponema sp.]
MENRKTIGLFSAICICVGLIVASSCLLSLGQGMGLAGKWFVLSIVMVSVLNMTLALSFGELNALMPDMEGGLGQFTKVGLGPVLSIISNISAYVIVSFLAGSVEIAMCAMILNEVFFPAIPVPVIGAAVVLILAAVNYLGINIFSRVQNFVVAALVLSLVALGVISFFKLGTGELVDKTLEAPPALGGFSGALSLTALAFWLFIGVEFIIPLSKNLIRPKRNVLLAMSLSILLLCVIQSVLGTGMTNYVTCAELASAELPHMVFANKVLGEAGSLWMGIITILAAISTANTLFGTVPAMMCGMAKNDMLPAIFAKKNRFHVNVAGIALIGGGFLVMVTTGLTQSAGLINMLLAASCFWLTSYILVSITVLVLRRRYPDLPARDKRLTLGGVPQYLCIAGDLYMIWHIAEGDDRILIYKIFAVLLVVLTAFACFWVKGIKKQALFRPADIHEVMAQE